MRESSRIYSTKWKMRKMRQNMTISVETWRFGGAWFQFQSKETDFSVTSQKKKKGLDDFVKNMLNFRSYCSLFVLGIGQLIQDQRWVVHFQSEFKLETLTLTQPPRGSIQGAMKHEVLESCLVHMVHNWGQKCKIKIFAGKNFKK